MKILLAHKYMWRGGGTATYLFALIDELERRGQEWIPFTVGYEKTALNTYTDYFVSPPLGADVSHYEQMHLSPLSMLKLLGRATYSFEARSKADQLVAATDPDLAYVHNIYNYMSPSMLHSFAKRELPVVMRVPDYNMICAELHFLQHGQMCTECLNGSYWKAVQHRCLKSSLGASAARAFSMYVHRWMHVYDTVDLFITPSAFMRDRLIDAGFDGDRIVHLQSFYPGQISEIEEAEEEDYILYFGRVAPEKAIDTLIRASAQLEGGPRVLIAGGDVDGTETKLRELADEVGATQVEFVGFQDRESLDRLIAGSLFTVVPSRWYDNCPMSVLESFAHAKPVVASAVGGIPEQITPECGILCEPDDPTELAGAMQTLLADSSLRRSMGQAARQRLQTHYSPDLHCDRLLELFEGLVA